MFVYVTNKNDFVHHDRFDGQDYIFQPGVAQVVPVDACVHMLGWNKVDKTPALLRLGWANQGDMGVKKLAKFVITEAKFEKPPEAEAIEQPRVEIPESPDGADIQTLGNPNKTPVFAGQPRPTRQAPA